MAPLPVSVRTDSLAARNGFELPVPLVSFIERGYLPVSLSPSALIGAHGERRTDRKRATFARTNGTGSSNPFRSSSQSLERMRRDIKELRLPVLVDLEDTEDSV